jgi:hypothetical protein
MKTTEEKVKLVIKCITYKFKLLNSTYRNISDSIDTVN